MDIRIRQVRQVIDELVVTDRADNDTKEIIFDRELDKIKKLDRDGIIDVVRTAIGNNPKRKRFAPFVYSALCDVDGIEDVFSELLESSDDLGRSYIIQTIGLRKIHDLVGVLNRHYYRETDDFCKDMTLHALGVIADESSLPIFRQLMHDKDHSYKWRILSASHRFASAEFKDYLTGVFHDESTKPDYKIMAAWGLAKLGESRPYDYLVSMLDDPEIRTTTFYDPGHSLRAAQAISDINGWDFEWSAVSVKLVRQKLAEQKSC